MWRQEGAHGALPCAWGMGRQGAPPYSSITDQNPSTPSVDLFSVET